MAVCYYIEVEGVILMFKLLLGYEVDLTTFLGIMELDRTHGRLVLFCQINCDCDKNMDDNKVKFVSQAVLTYAQATI
jgi:hypothetical protein